eukprot:g12963.t1
MTLADYMFAVDSNNIFRWKLFGSPSIGSWTDTLHVLIAHGITLSQFGADQISEHLKERPGSPGLSQQLARAAVGYLPTDYVSVTHASVTHQPQPDQLGNPHLPPRCPDIWGNAVAAVSFGAHISRILPQAPQEAALLTDQQLLLEARAVAKLTASANASRKHLLKLIAKCDAKLGAGNNNAFLETASNSPQFINTRPLLCPARGPVCISVRVAGVPILALLSTASPFTRISPALCSVLKLSQERLSPAARFLTFQGKEVGKECARVARLPLELGGTISLTLTTALCMDLELYPLQLGADFFAQAVRCRIDVVVEDTDPPVMASILPARGPDWLALTKQTGDEELRFHAADGQTVTLPLLHVHERDKSSRVQLTWGIDQRVQVQVCEWCARALPGLLRCARCHVVFYCTIHCQRAHWGEHKPLCRAARTRENNTTVKSKVNTAETKGSLGATGGTGQQDKQERSEGKPAVAMGAAENKAPQAKLAGPAVAGHASHSLTANKKNKKKKGNVLTR